MKQKIIFMFAVLSFFIVNAMSFGEIPFTIIKGSDTEKCKEECDNELEVCLLQCEEWASDIRYICTDNCVFDYHYNCIPACEQSSTSTITPECETDDDCEDDGLFCNGEEICLDKKCVSEGNPCPAETICMEQLDFCDAQHTSIIPTTTTTEEPSSYTSTTTTCACPILCSYGDFAEEAEFLRYIRDNVLSQSPEGQELIRLYYEWSPLVVRAIEQDEDFKEEVKEMIDGVLTLIREEIK